MKGERVTGRAVSIPKGLALGTAVSLAVTVVITALGAHLIETGMIEQSSIGWCSLIAIVSSTIAGGIVAVKKIKKRRLMVCMLSGMCYYGSLLMITALFFGGQYEGCGVTLLVILIGSFAAALILNREGTRDGRRSLKKVQRGFVQN